MANLAHFSGRTPFMLAFVSTLYYLLFTRLSLVFPSGSMNQPDTIDDAIGSVSVPGKLETPSEY